MSGSWIMPRFGGGAFQVPEPAMPALLGGAVMLLAVRRRRTAKRA